MFSRCEVHWNSDYISVHLPHSTQPHRPYCSQPISGHPPRPFNNLSKPLGCQRTPANNDHGNSPHFSVQPVATPPNHIRSPAEPWQILKRSTTSQPLHRRLLWFFASCPPSKNTQADRTGYKTTCNIKSTTSSLQSIYIISLIRSNNSANNNYLRHHRPIVIYFWPSTLTQQRQRHYLSPKRFCFHLDSLIRMKHLNLSVSYGDMWMKHLNLLFL